MYKKIKNTDLEPYPISLGTALYGSSISEKDSHEFLSIYHDHGGNLIDTANIYGQWEKDKLPHSEIVIGKWLKNINRDKVILVTKGAHPDFDTMDKKRVTKKDILFDLDQSLKNLKTDYIDMYYLHRDDPTVEVSYIMDVLNEIKKSGKIRYYACSNYKTDRIIAANKYAKEKNIDGFISNQVMFNLAKVNGNPAGIDSVEMDNEMYQMHKKSGLCIMAYSSIASGLFALIMEKDFFTSDKYIGIREKYLNSTTNSVIKAVKEYSIEYDIDTATLALLYVMNQPFTSIPIIGPMTKDQLLSSLAAVNIKQLKDVYEQLTTLKGFDK